MSYLVKQAGIISAADFLRLAVKTIIGIILARILTQMEFGTYRQLFMIYTLVSAIFLVGLPQSVYYFLPKSDDETRKKIITQTLDIVSLMGLTCAVAVLFTRGTLATLFNNPGLFKVLTFYAFYPYFMFVSQLYYSVMIALQKPRQAAYYVLVSIFCDLILILGVAILTKNLVYIVIAVVASALIQWIYARISIRKHQSHLSLKHFDKEILKTQFRYALPIGVASIIGVVSTQVDKLVISSYFSPELFAVFAIGATELPFIGIITNSVNAVILPEMNKRNDGNSIAELYKGAVRKNALLLFPAFLFCFILAPQIIQALYSAKYLEAVSFFRIYLFTMPLRIATYGILFQVYNKTKYIFVISLMTLVVNTALSLLFIKYFGLKGPAIAAVFVTYLAVMAYLVLAKLVLHLELSRLFPFGALVRTLVAGLISCIFLYPIIFIVKGVFLQLFLSAIVYLIIYLIIGRVTGAILPYDTEMVKSIMSGVLKRIKGASNV